MTLFFLILLTASLVIFGFQKLKKKTKLTIKPSLPKVEESQPVEAQIPEKLTPEPVIAEPENPMPTPEPVEKEEEIPEWPPEPGPRPALPPEEEPILLSPKEPEPPGNLPIG